MSVLYLRAMTNLTEANEEAGFAPRLAFIRAFVQVIAASAEDVLLLAGGMRE